MSTSAQINANRQNAQHSTGPKTDHGKAASALNNFRYGFTGAFCILAWEHKEEYDLLYGNLLHDHQPADSTEHLLVTTMAQSYWLRQRALNIQQMCFISEAPMCRQDAEKQLALYLRYQTTHDRAFNKALDQLLKLRADKRKQQIGFESQERERNEQERKWQEQELTAQRREAMEKRREAAANRAEELHQARVWLTEAQARRHETETTIARVLKMPASHQNPARPEEAKAA